MARGLFEAVLQNSEGQIPAAGTAATLYETDGTTLLAQAIYAAESGGSPVSTTVTTDARGRIKAYAARGQRLKVNQAGTLFDSAIWPDPTYITTLSESGRRQIFDNDLADPSPATAAAVAPSINGALLPAGATTYTYWYAGKNGQGLRTALSASAAIASKQWPPNATQYNALSWSAISGVTSYEIYRSVAGGATETQVLIATVTGSTSYNDVNGATSASTAAPTHNETGEVQAHALQVDGYAHFGPTGGYNLPNSTVTMAGTYSQSHQLLFVDAGYNGTGLDGGAAQFISRDYGFNQTRSINSLVIRNATADWVSAYAGHTGNGWLFQPFQASMALAKRGTQGTNQDYTIFGITGCNEHVGLYMINQAYPLVTGSTNVSFGGSMANNAIYIGGQDGWEYGWVADDVVGTAAGGGVPLGAFKMYNRGSAGVPSTPVALGWLGLGVDPTVRLHLGAINEAATDRMMLIDSLMTSNNANQVEIRSNADSNRRLILGYQTSTLYGNVTARTTGDLNAPLVLNYHDANAWGGPVFLGMAPTGTPALGIKQSANTSAGGVRGYRSDSTNYVAWYTGGDNKAYIQPVGGTTPPFVAIAGENTQPGLLLSAQTGHSGLLADFQVNGVSFASISAAGSVTFAGAETQTGIIAPAQLVANTDNWNPTGLATARIIRASTDASRNLTGIVAQATGFRLSISNVGAQDLVLVHDATSTAANRFSLPGAANLTLSQGSSVDLYYDGTSARWRPAA